MKDSRSVGLTEPRQDPEGDGPRRFGGQRGRKERLTESDAADQMDKIPACFAVF